MREVFVTELVKEVLGPRYGLHEEMDKSPLSEYITGVLAPIINNSAREILNLNNEDTQLEQEIEQKLKKNLNENIDYDEELSESDIDLNSVPAFSSSLDPQNKPPSMGLSFIVECSEKPEAEICLTWAFYEARKKSEKARSKSLWIRTPFYKIVQTNLNNNSVYYYNKHGHQVNSLDSACISFHVISRKLKEKCYFVSLYLVNRTNADSEQVNNIHNYIFQPQIRVVFTKGTYSAKSIKKSQSGEDEIMDFLYRKHPVKAKGHFCSAVWKDIDIQIRSLETVDPDFKECLKQPPFYWDEQILLPKDKKHFTEPDLRTEFVPIYNKFAPDYNWPNGYGNLPELRPSALAEMINYNNLEEALSPVYKGYEFWINDLKNTVDEENRIIIEKLITGCENVLRRIKLGMETLKKYESVRLAFCFANKAINLQYEWSKEKGNKSELKWRPFQIAFILMSLESIVEHDSPDKDVCDLLWVSTGAGKTEAYLALLAFTIAYRRIVQLAKGQSGAGVAVITRYTLRLLTIQQFRRTLSLVTACEYLRVLGIMKSRKVGWSPDQYQRNEGFLWGSSPFSIGLWVGGNVTPNRIDQLWANGKYIPGAIGILKGEKGEGEPAQIVNCPSCSSILAVSHSGLQPGSIHKIHLSTKVNKKYTDDVMYSIKGTINNIEICEAVFTKGYSNDIFTLTIDIKSSNTVTAKNLDNLWNEIKEQIKKAGIEVDLVNVRASRPGYFIKCYIGSTNAKAKDYDFEIYCSNPDCPLQTNWFSGSPSGSISGREAQLSGPTTLRDNRIPNINDGNRFNDIYPAFRGELQNIGTRIPINALIVDEQLYSRLPTVIVATVDKFARPPFDPRAAGFFGNVELHHCIWGYYRRNQPSLSNPSEGHPGPKGIREQRNYQEVSLLPSPALIIQDELHLIQGPLGSLVGVYETAVDFLCGQGKTRSIKYIASSATVRRAEEQVKSVFQRDLQVFPPHGLEIDDSFFIRSKTSDCLNDKLSGRLYAGISSPGRGPLTPIVRIWSRLMQTAFEYKDSDANSIDGFWTLTGYFNAVRELAGARALYRQDIPERIRQIANGERRKIPDDNSSELSGRTSSVDLPAILNVLERKYPGAQDSLFTTSMFGTGVDISRLGLMLVNGQPKTTSDYIQATGRVGRKNGALIVTFLRASRPRDLSHYEFFCGYHCQMYRFVEPVTVYPFSPGVLERTLGPVGIFMLRTMKRSEQRWHEDTSPQLMENNRTTSEDIRKVTDAIENRSQGQPEFQKPDAGTAKRYIASRFDLWSGLARRHKENLEYYEYALNKLPQSPVVLGDQQHKLANLDMVCENAPQSLRDVESTTGFQTSTDYRKNTP